MKIIVIGPYFPYRGGIADTNQELCNELKQNGHTVIVLNFKLQYPSLLFPGKSQFSNKTSELKIKSKRVINSINPFNWISIAKLINYINPDLVITSYWTAFLSPCISCINKLIDNKINTIGLIHNAYPHEKGIFQKNLLKLFLKSIDKYISLSKNVSKQIKLVESNKKGETLFHPIPTKFGNPIEKKIAKEKLGLNSNYKYLLFFGLIRKYKGLDILIKAMSEIIKQNNKIKLLVVGENYESINKYKKLAIEENVINNIFFKNEFIKENEVKYWFCSSDLIIQPYKSASQSGITPLSVQFEVPTICSNINGLSEYIIDNKDGFLSKTNPKDLAKKILFALNSDLNLIKQGIKIKKKKLTWKHFVNKLIL